MKLQKVITDLTKQSSTLGNFKYAVFIDGDCFLFYSKETIRHLFETFNEIKVYLLKDICFNSYIELEEYESKARENKTNEQTTKKEFFGHGVLKCSKCFKTIAQCRCMDHTNIHYSICNECKK
jgi:hypothetical protein